MNYWKRPVVIDQGLPISADTMGLVIGLAA